MGVLVNQRMDHGCTKESEEGGSAEATQAPQGGSGSTGGSAEAQASSQVSDVRLSRGSGADIARTARRERAAPAHFLARK